MQDWLFGSAIYFSRLFPDHSQGREPTDQDMKPITGSIVALATPLHDDGSVDYPTLRKLVDWHIAEGTDCIGVVGTTGESPTVNVEEHCEIIRVSVEQAKKRVPIMAGCGANSTAEAIELARFAKQVGADCQLQVVPYYNKPTQEGQYRHFKAIAEAVGDLPIVLYNVPGRTVADMAHATVLRLAQVPGIVGIKEATGNIERAQWLIKEVPQGFAVYSGDDPTAVALMLCGGQGNVSVTANIAPRLMHELCVAAVAGDARRAMELQFKLLPLHRNLFVEANPIPVKWAMARMGLCGGTLRLPMTPLDTSNEAAVEGALRACGLI
ncbi:dihydrodipicolinate synthase [Polaromonas sp. JS666]|nr:dihydrodipicolinate synthase [Polaromonas sp. JS666]